MQLRPGEKFTIVRQLDNPADVNTYYPQAIIRDSKTDVIIDTLDLDDKTGQRFTKIWEVISDSSGEGRYVDIETRIYTDALHTTMSTTYGIESETYLIAERPNQLGQGGGDTPDIDYKKISKIVADAQVKPEKVSLAPVMTKIDELISEVQGQQKIESVDLQPLHDAIQAITKSIEASQALIVKAIDDKEVTPGTDLQPVLDAVGEVDPAPLLDALKTVSDNMHNFLGGDLQKILETMNALKKSFDEMPYFQIFTNAKKADIVDAGTEEKAPALPKRNRSI